MFSYDVRIVKDVSEVIPPSNRGSDKEHHWQEIGMTGNEDQFFDKNCKPVNLTYKGHVYKVVSMYKRKFPVYERIGRVFLGVLATVCTLSLAYWFSKNVKCLIKATKEKRVFLSLFTNGTLSDFYKANHIVKGDEPLRLDSRDVFFTDIDEDYSSELMDELHTLTACLIVEINKKIQWRNWFSTIEERRGFHLDVFNEPLKDYYRRLISSRAGSSSPEDNMLHNSYIGVVLKKLVRIGAIYSYCVGDDNLGYKVQV